MKIEVIQKNFKNAEEFKKEVVEAYANSDVTVAVLAGTPVDGLQVGVKLSGWSGLDLVEGFKENGKLSKFEIPSLPSTLILLESAE